MTSFLLVLIACLMEGLALMFALGAMGLIWAIPVSLAELLPYGLVAGFGFYALQSWRG